MDNIKAESVKMPPTAPPASAAAPKAPTAALPASATAVAAATKVKDVVEQGVTNVVESPAWKLFLYLLAGIFIIIVLGLGLYWLVNRTINKRQVYRFPETEVPLVGTQITTITADKVPESRNGKRQTLSFWIYINDLDKYSGQYRHVLHRGDRTDIWDKASPAVYLDKASNKLHVTIGSESNDPYDRNKPNDTVTTDHKFGYIQKTRGVTIDYIPLQRWVHIAVIVNEEVNNGTITVYMDGELIQVASSEKTFSVPWGTNTNGETNYVSTKLSIQNSNLNKKGNIFVGGTSTDDVGPGFSGLVSRVAIFNYDLNAKDIYHEYRKGPVGTIAGKIGYGVRTPVYRIG